MLEVTEGKSISIERYFTFLMYFIYCWIEDIASLNIFKNMVPIPQKLVVSALSQVISFLGNCNWSGPCRFIFNADY